MPNLTTSSAVDTFMGSASNAAALTNLGAVASGGALGTPSSGNLANCTSIPAGNLTGSVATARLGSGTADATTYLRGDATWATVSGPNYTLKTANYTAVAGDKIVANTSGGAFTISLPASPTNGDSVEIIPAVRPLANLLTINRNGQTINGSAVNVVFQTNMCGVRFLYTSTNGWFMSACGVAIALDGGLSATGTQGNNDTFNMGGVNIVGGFASNFSRLTFSGSARLTGNSEFLNLDNNGSGNPFGLGNISRIEFKQQTSGGTPASNSARIYSKDVAGTAEMFVIDEAGNETQISPHNTAAPEILVDSAFDEIGYTANYYTGIITYTNKQRQIAGRADAQFFETFEEHNLRIGESLEILDWDTVQADHVAKRDEEREAWADRKAEWEANPNNENKPFADPEPEVLTAKPMPTWLADQLAGKEEFLANRLQINDLPPPPDYKIWSNAQTFMAEFTMPEKAGIALSTDPTIAALRLELSTWFSEVHSTDPRVVAGLDKLVELDIITEDRKDEIITL